MGKTSPAGAGDGSATTCFHPEKSGTCGLTVCGIAGILLRGGERPSRPLLLEMAGELRHRGPDGTGLYLDGPLAMVNTRLSIVDLAGGDQPIGTPDGRYWVVQNGEIYNFPELTAELEALGHRFRTRCDTEVIVHAYQQWGPGCLDRFNGPFAFAVWDRQARTLFLARDRLGIRPLFVAEVDNALLFASEAKALLRYPGLARAIDPLGMVETFTTWVAGPDRSAFAGVRELAAGHHLTAGLEGPVVEKEWWDVALASPDGIRHEGEAVLAEEVYALLEDATRLRLRADVPVGAYLSGGLDSSATAAIVKRLTSKTLRSFAVRFDDARFDEREHQEKMARILGTDLTSIDIHGPDMAEIFPEIIWLTERPILRTAPAPLYLLSKAVRDSGFKVVLTGEGADEVFAGYGIFKEDKVRRFWAKNPSSKMRPLLLRRLYPYLARDLGRAEAFMRGFFGRHLTDTDDPLYSHRIRFENTSRCLRYLSTDLVAAAASAGDVYRRLEARLPPRYHDATPLARAQYLEIKTFLQGYLLHSQGDRMLMGNSVEGRFPFLDHRLVELAFRLPDNLRLKALREKYLLRKAVARVLPDDIAARPKRPYRAPILGAFVGPRAPGYLAELLSESSLTGAGLFQAEAVRRLLDKCRRSLADGVSETDEMALVGIVSAMLLHERFVARPVLRPAVEPTKVVEGADLQSLG